MAILRQQTNHGFSSFFGSSPGKKINQSFFIDQIFSLDSIDLWYNNVGSDPINDVRVRCEIRKSVGDENLIDLSQSPLDYSGWVEDSDLTLGEYNHSLNSLSFSPGIYWISIVSNTRISLNNISFGSHQNGPFLEKHILTLNGVGIYRNDKSLYYKINGSLSGSSPVNNTYTYNQSVITIMRDET